MVQRVSTVAFEGIEARSVDVQVQVAPGLPAFAIVGSINPDDFGSGLVIEWRSLQSLLRRTTRSRILMSPPHLAVAATASQKPFSSGFRSVG
jgi:hypothetical protein